MNSRLIVFGIMAIIYVFVFLKIYFNEKKNTTYKITTKSIVRVGVFGAISAVLYITIKFPVPFLPPFMEFHFDEVPVFIASFAYGPVSGLCVLLVKTLIKLPLTSTLGVGELSDLIYSAALILPAAIIYNKKRNFKSVFIGLGIGCLLEVVVAIFANIYVMIPFYMSVMGLSEQAILAMCQGANPAINNIGWGYGLYAVLPFNLLKNAMVIVLTLFSYKSTHKFIDKLQK